MSLIEGKAACSPDSVLEIRGLSLDFSMPGGDIHAVDDVDITVRRGKITMLVGESGSGKSAAALAVMGVDAKNAVIKGGRILLAGRDVLSMPKKEKRSYIACHAGFIFQDPMDSLNPLFTIGYQLTEALIKLQGVSKKQARELAVTQLRELRLPQPEELLGKYPFMLSGGMCQRVMIAMAAIRRPPLLIADEPTTALDVTVQTQILRLLDRMRKTGEIGILMITHDFGVVAELADDVYIMRNGKIVEKGEVEAIFTRPQRPYTRELLDAAL
ncbi:MAG: ABC transporter ATP-binding protein [Treponema sp.]|jgi:ABC-type dipeptide/oligopeptide/nickel transport system ATPase component|nr:ABC transporter ATP-binding protein [Treponema sp.]